MDGMIIHRLPTWFKISNTPMNPFWYWWIKRIFASVKPDLIHVHSPVPIMADMAILAARATPVVITYHAGSMRKQRYPVDFFITAYESLFLPQLFKLTAAIVAVSPAFATNQLRRFSQKVSIVPPGVDLDRFSSDGTGMESQMVTYVGRIERSSSWKGIEQLLQAMALVHAYFPHARLELVGDGDAVDYYRARSIALGIGSLVTFAGSKKARALADVYRHSAVVVLPSLTEAESFGTVLLEAMASGSPVIGSAVGGIPFLIDNEKNGILVAPKDSAALAHAIGRILGNPELARRFSVNGISKAQHYGWDVQLLKYRSLFEQVLRKSL
jgi:glycosyltransferase involved in cell wall biosynthesis